MSLKGFGNKAFSNSKVSSSKIISDSHSTGVDMVRWGNSSKINIGLKSNTKGASDPTTDIDD